MEVRKDTFSPRRSRRLSKPPMNLGLLPPEKATSSGPSHPHVRYLVICGAMIPSDIFIFSDFMGICMMLKEKGVSGDFVSCFPLLEAFKHLEVEHPTQAIRFGKVRQPGASSDGYIYEYTREQFRDFPLWYTEQRAEIIKDYVVRWVTNAAEETKRGDIVNIIFEGHGHRRRGMALGDVFIKSDEWVTLLSLFSSGVQVNSISGACYSGSFVDAITASGQGHRYSAAASTASDPALSQTRSSSGRIRNSRFSQAFVQSFARISLPGIPTPSHQALTIDEHHTFMTQQTARNITPGHHPNAGQHGLTSPITGQDLVMKVILNNMIDCVYDPAIAHRRRRLEYARYNDPSFRHLFPQRGGFATAYYRANVNSSPQAKDFASRIIASEFSKCGGESLLSEDHACMDELVGVPLVGRRLPNHAAILHALYYRGRQQSAIWDLYCALVDKDFIDPSGLLVPTTFRRISDAAADVMSLLSCFELQDNWKTTNNYALQNQPNEMPSLWLAIMIIRGCKDIEQLFETIKASCFLGSLDEDRYQDYLHENRKREFVVNPREGEGPPGTPGPFGLWLPHGLQGSTPSEAFHRIYPEHLARFNLIEEAFKMYFDLSDDQVLLERDQETYFNEYPEKLPGFAPGGQ